MNRKQKTLTVVALIVLVFSATNAPWEWTETGVTWGNTWSHSGRVVSPIWEPRGGGWGSDGTGIMYRLDWSAVLLTWVLIASTWAGLMWLAAGSPKRG